MKLLRAFGSGPRPCSAPPIRIVPPPAAPDASTRAWSDRTTRSPNRATRPPRPSGAAPRAETVPVCVIATVAWTRAEPPRAPSTRNSPPMRIVGAAISSSPPAKTAPPCAEIAPSTATAPPTPRSATAPGRSAVELAAIRPEWRTTSSTRPLAASAPSNTRPPSAAITPVLVTSAAPPPGAVRTACVTSIASNPSPARSSW